MAVVKAKKRIGSKKTKKGWRRSDIQDVEDFLEDKRLEERLGVPFKDRKDEELFSVDTKADNDNLKYQSSKEARRNQLLAKPVRCFEILKSDSKVQDPIAKRNIRRSAEDRQHPAFRKREEEKLKRKKGIVKRKEVDNRAQAIRKFHRQAPRSGFKKDIWNEEVALPATVKTDWVNEGTRLHVLANTRMKDKLRRPKEKNLSKPYKTPAVELPLPGQSYNPSYEDHISLLETITTKEQALAKADAHLTRVTSAMFRKVPRHEAEAQYFREMSQGVPALDPEAAKPDEPLSDNEYHAVNPPVDRLKKKDRKKRRNIVEEKRLQNKNKLLKAEKKKLADIYRLNQFEEEIVNQEEKTQKRSEKRIENDLNRTTRRLGRQKFEENELDFNMASDLKGSLRSIKPEGNILSDRYNSMQKRNILEPASHQL
ncbi:hypothetical protein ONE63_007244 [Megalurothrips usitatus]|uniref:Ribosome biogenesis protein NOP53 n=1 Tax=Megalurothrips usitatus TaxID=439358 RepID=A0AAV7XVJ0_9NEOP|nr:hypothetical protein ONE63_007244 [Megalurothrips usitatus]